jgi:hypothetical protein
LNDKGNTVYQSFRNKTEMTVVLSGQFENPMLIHGKRVLFFNKHEWFPCVKDKDNAWDTMYRDIVKHYYDDMIDITGIHPRAAAQRVMDYIDAEERKTDKS